MTIDFEEIRRHLTTGSRLEAVLRGHLWVEVLINGAIESALAHPDALRLDRMSFSAKLSLGNALGVLPGDDMPWFRTLNKMRNRLAHDLDGAPSDDEVRTLETSLAGEARTLFDSLVDDYGGTNGLLVLSFAVQLVRLEYARRVRVYEVANREGLQHFRLQAALHEMAGTKVTDEQARELRASWGVPPPPTVWEVIGRPDPDPAS